MRQLGYNELVIVNQAWFWWNKNEWRGTAGGDNVRRFTAFAAWMDDQWGVRDRKGWVVADPEKYTLFLLRWA